MCEGGNQTIEGSSGHIESPGYPETFTLEGDRTCLITLVVRGPAAVVLVVDGLFHIPTAPSEEQISKRCHNPANYLWIGSVMLNKTVCGELSGGASAVFREIIFAPVSRIEIGYQDQDTENTTRPASVFRLELLGGFTQFLVR